MPFVGEPMLGKSPGVVQSIVQIIALMRISIPSKTSKEAMLLLFITGLAFGVGVADACWYLFNKMLAEAIREKEWERIWWFLVPTIGVYGIAKAAVKATSNMLVVKTFAMLRKRVMILFHDLYMDSNTKLFYVTNDLDKRLDNVDSRISNDVEFCFNDFAEFFFGGLRQTEGGFVAIFACYCTGVVLCFISMTPEVGFFVFGSSIAIFIPSILLKRAEIL